MSHCGPAPYGVYVHIPFCQSRCDYCAFVTYVGVDDLHERYCDAVVAEIEARSAEKDGPATSVFFGGGTPSRVDPLLLGRILAAIDRAPGCEVTIEVNPEDAAPERLAAFVRAGVTRMSVGIQSTAPHVLAGLGRVHRGDQVRSVAKAVASSGVSTWSMDLIVGSVEETDDDVIRSVNDLLDHEHAPPHVSAYLLSVEKGTPLSRDVNRHPDDDVLAERYELVDSLLEDRGYRWYEVSNWARDGHRCRHNQLYWSQGDYLGVGVAAHSHARGMRRWNVANLTTYLELVERGASPLLGFEELSEAQRAFESLSLGLRTAEGVPIEAIERPDDLEGFVERRGDRLVLTVAGRRMADAIARRLVVPGDSVEGVQGAG